MGITQSINRINFEKTQNIIKQNNNINFIIINTLNQVFIKDLYIVRILNVKQYILKIMIIGKKITIN